MKYLLMIYGNEAAYPTMTQAEIGAMIGEYAVFAKDAAQRGILLGGESLEPTHTATTLRIRDGKTLITDGPYAETKEQFGGYYLLDCKDLDEALQMAARIPDVRSGAVEVRQIKVWNG